MRSTQYLVFSFVLGCTASAEAPSSTFGSPAKLEHDVDASAPVGSATVQSALVPARANDVAVAARPVASECPSGMILVEGDYCPDVEQRCLEWMDPPGPYQFFRCKRYAQPAVCKSKKRLHEKFCIDERERTEPGSDLPRNHQSWTMAKKLCEADGARLCLTREWMFACEGEDMRPYPYGWQRDASVCNADIDHGLGHIGGLVDRRTPASAHPACTSAFGVHDMAGNVDEWTTIEDAPRGSREVMHGSWWMPGRNACRSYQGGHGAYYEGTETGARCCADTKEP